MLDRNDPLGKIARYAFAGAGIAAIVVLYIIDSFKLKVEAILDGR